MMTINIPQKKKKTKLKIIIVLVIIGAIFAGARLFYLYYMTSLKEISVPNIVGLKYYEAYKLLADLNLKPVLGATKASHDHEKDIVMETVPPAGRVVKEGNKISLVVSSGIDKVGVPNLIGETIRTAKKFAIEKNFTLNQTDKYSMSIKEGEIVSQNPTAGEEIEKGLTVNIVVSLGYPVEVRAIDLGMGDVEHKFLVKISFLVPKEWKKQEVKIIAKDSDVETKLFQEVMSSGEKKHIEHEAGGNDSIEVYYDGKLIIKKQVSDIGN